MLEELFRLNGGGGEKTRLFAELSATVQAELARMAAFIPEEEPVIAYFGDQSAWLLVTTRRLIWAQGESRGTFGLVDLDLVDRDFRSAMVRRLSAPENSKASFKDLMDRLHIQGTDGRRVALSLEAGQPFFTMSGVLGSICHWAEDWRQGRRW